MDTTIEIFREEIRKLVEQFERDNHFYLSKQYLEAQARQDFIDPFFESLGWDIGNRAGLSPFEREVLLEKGETKGRPDYNFRIDGATKFYVEAKAPSEPLDKTAHIMQAKSYAWNTRDVFIVVLTDFEEFKVFDASLKPDPRNPNRGLIYDFKYTDYLEKLDELWMLSKEKVASGSIDKLLLKDAQSKRLRIPVDKSFLSDMTGWREELAKNLYKRNPDINVRLLNEVVQRILDRFVFIRIAEDRKIIEPKSLLELVELWKSEGKRRPLQYHLNIFFRQINGDLNGEIFKPHACETHEYDSSLLAKIIEWLYFPKCPYRFDVIGVELLGSIYERYLGNTIRLTAKRVKVEEKPEVRKAGGVYYTPKYIVDYIVDNTVGKLIEGKTPEEIAEIKILDPACGSGSFLLGAYQELIDYHIKYYTEHPAEAGRSTLFPDLIIEPDGSHRLSITKKAEILQNNIFGVDIDPQAVEVSMMSLYIKALEGERTLPQNKELLPSLANNIKCGNSLIGYDFFEQQTLIEDEERDRINPFEWDSRNAGFGEILEKGGFDVVVGNPPWGADFSEKELQYLREKNKQIIVRMIDSFMYFVYQSSCKVNNKGHFGMILPDVILYQNDNIKLREYLLANYSISRIANLGNGVFGKVTRPSCIVISHKEKEDSAIRVINCSKDSPDKIESSINDETLFESLGQNVILNIPGKLFVTNSVNDYKILEKVKSKPNEILANLVDDDGIQRGVSPDLKEAFIVDENIIKKYELESFKLKKVLTGGKHVKRYYIGYQGDYLIYNTNKDDFSKIPNICAYIKQFKDRITCKEVIQKKHSMYALHRPRKESIFTKNKKILGVITEDEIIVALDENSFYATDGLYLFSPIEEINPRYLMGILNSRLFKFLYRLISLESGRVLAQVKPKIIAQLPIRTIDFNNSKEKETHDKLVALVDRMLELNSKKNALPPSSERERIEREIAVTDEKIDEIVYGLYGLTEEEIRVVESE